MPVELRLGSVRVQTGVSLRPATPGVQTTRTASLERVENALIGLLGSFPPRHERVANGTRTRDHRDHNPGLYQLSYRHRAPLIVAASQRRN